MTEFKGTIGRTLADSEPHFEERPHPGDGAPNVVFVLLDDTGFAQFGCYGSDIDTPNIDALAGGGVQFTNFHVTPVCSPTRAALLTGRSQHEVGMRGLAGWITGFPHATGHISDAAATVAEVLRGEGYATLCAGKWHLMPGTDISAAGPFDHWPLGRGFERFYGFLPGETDQFHPELVRDNTHIDPPSTPEEGYHLSEDLVDQLLLMINDNKSVRPDRPFFAYLPFGATHAPHQAPQDYLDKYRGRYDEGWDVVRQRWFERQVELGVVDPDTTLAPRNPGVEPWDDLSDNQQRLACRLQEAFAAFLDHTDDQIGRFVDGLRAMGELDNTILVLLSDNGASQEGGASGTMHEMKHFQGIKESPDEAIERIDDIGGPRSHTNYPWGWAQCGNSPFRWYKTLTHEGGVHVPMVVHWPNGLGDEQAGTKRDQFAYVSDIVPTIYDLLGITPPDTYRGVQQMPVTGHSFASVLDDAGAPATNTLQYFEFGGNRALVAELDGVSWKAVTRHLPGTDFDDDRWELYDLSADPSECNDLAEVEPDRLAELIDLWWQEADRHGVLPLDERRLELFIPRIGDHEVHRPDRRYTYRPPMTPIPTRTAASLTDSVVDITARVSRGADDHGVLIATGNENCGVSVFVQEGRLVVDYNAFGDHTVLESSIEVPAGDCTLAVHLERDVSAGWVELSIDGKACGRAAIPLYLSTFTSVGASVGEDHGSAVSARYTAPFAFAGTLHDVTVQLPDGRDASRDDATAKSEWARQ
ncbi:MAG: arylsulfatase [Acidimicrobiia bacterium]|nr:arylsulfatase [Acidimicrobiia bacterium]MDH5236213.1 arylsulfatase [Acidimicrobiia bacterium]